MERCITSRGRIIPDPDRHEQYQPYLDRYIALYEQTKDLMHSL